VADEADHVADHVVAVGLVEDLVARLRVDLLSKRSPRMCSTAPRAGSSGARASSSPWTRVVGWTERAALRNRRDAREHARSNVSERGPSYASDSSA
jgi:hypothetical protein